MNLKEILLKSNVGDVIERGVSNTLYYREVGKLITKLYLIPAKDKVIIFEKPHIKGDRYVRANLPKHINRDKIVADWWLANEDQYREFIPPHFEVMNIVRRMNGKFSRMDVYSQSEVNRVTIYAALRRFEEKGLIERVGDDEFICKISDPEPTEIERKRFKSTLEVILEEFNERECYMPFSVDTSYAYESLIYTRIVGMGKAVRCNNSRIMKLSNVNKKTKYGDLDDLRVDNLDKHTLKQWQRLYEMGLIEYAPRFEAVYTFIANNKLFTLNDLRRAINFNGFTVTKLLYEFRNAGAISGTARGYIREGAFSSITRYSDIRFEAKNEPKEEEKPSRPKASHAWLFEKAKKAGLL